jgi:SET domain-containing protein
MDDFIVKEAPGKGRGLFATKNYEKGQVLFEFDGIKLGKEKAWVHPQSEKLLQIGPTLYLDVSDHYSVFTNHSCNPNCCVKISIEHAFLVACLPIKAGDELTFDYSTTSTESPTEWSMSCKCSIFGCRKNISGFHSLPYRQQQLYIEQGFVPYYLKA